MADDFADEDMRTADFADVGYEGNLAEDYAERVAEQIGEDGDYDKVGGAKATYIDQKGTLFPDFRLAVEAKDTKVRYNHDLVSNGDFLDAVNEAAPHISNEDVGALLEGDTK